MIMQDIKSCLDRVVLILIAYIGVMSIMLFLMNSLMHNRTVDEVREVRETVKENQKLIKELQVKFSNLSTEVKKLKK